jgi:predicted negative regulator of RcsB-dependent stress response
MTNNLFETQYDLTKKSKLREFYESNKIWIFSTIFTLIIIIASYSYYKDSKERKKILLSENYIQAKVYLESGNKTKALEILKNITFSNDATYSTLSFFMILNENLINDSNEISKLFDHLLQNNKFNKEIGNLLHYKKALFKSSFVHEEKFLEEVKPLLNSKEVLWKGHGLMLIGDFYFSKKEYIKAKDFYTQILTIKNLQSELYEQAKTKLINIAND